MADSSSLLTSALMSQAMFQEEVETMLSHFKIYENKSNQAAALAEVPVDYLMAVAQAKLESSDKETFGNKQINANDTVRDMFLLELMTWFKTEFFVWMDSPSCPLCSKPTVSIGLGIPTPEESSGFANRIEVYTCKNCFQDGREVARFPRYNDPVVLLRTRKGRCGEWANCFTLICRAVGFEVRYVRDWTDHVWLEVFSCGLERNRWVHVDPCENSYDNPLLYEKGWGKKLTYVVAVSQDDIQDVTWRYVLREKSNIQQVVSRRTLIDENTVVKTILRLREREQAYLPSNRKSILKSRLIEELVEFLSPNTPNDSELAGRESGSLAWRLARQELGSSIQDSTTEKHFVWNISEENICSSKFSLSYDCIKDQYDVQTNDNSKVEIKKGWSNGAFQSKNIFRKEESDWKMVYLTRKENGGSQNGSLSWRFRLSDPTLNICGVKISLLAATFNPSAKVSVTLADEKESFETLLDSNSVNGLFTWNSKDLNSLRILGSRVITLTCNLQGGQGNTAWQHAQLFRQSMIQNLDTPFAFSIVIHVSKIS